MTIAAMSFRCDRDGAEAAGGTTGAALPEGWLVLSLGGTGIISLSAHFCPTCAAAFDTFMKASGGTFTVLPPAKAT